MCNYRHPGLLRVRQGVRAAANDTISGRSGDVCQKSPPVETRRYFSKKSRLPSRRNATLCFRTFKSGAPVETGRYFLLLKLSHRIPGGCFQCICEYPAIGSVPRPPLIGYLGVFSVQYPRQRHRSGDTLGTFIPY